MNKRVSIFAVGVQKGGTTSLHAYFCEHPALSPPNIKETHFFDNESIDWSAPDLERLDSFYNANDGDRLRFDSTPIYSFWPPSLARIRDYNSQAKLIFLFRDPFERAWSQWCMEFARGDETLPFEEAIREGRNRLTGPAPLAGERRVYSYVERGFYAKQVRRALECFPREQLLFLRSEDLRDDHSATLARISSFLDIETFANAAPKREHMRPEATYPSSPTDSAVALVAEVLKEDLAEFAALTELDVSAWPSVQAQTAPTSSPRRQSAEDRRPNVLFIVADDLNSWIGALGSQPDIRTPSIDALARRGTLFTRAYCAAPYCNASRMSVFTGCLPTTTGVYRNEPFWDATGRRKTYIEALREAGYYVRGAGKVFHGIYDYATAGQERALEAAWIPLEHRANIWDHFDTNPPEPLPAGRPLNRLFDFEQFQDVPAVYHHFDWGPLTDEVESKIPDEVVCRSTTDFLLGSPKEPFFCAAGLYKPHLPWHVPKRFFDMYDPDKISLPTVRPDDLDDVPPMAKQWALSPQDHELVTARGQWRQAVQAYLAAISYCDWIVGRIVDALDRSGLADNTTIVLCSDNGFHLGEKLHWRKFVLWEEATRVPLLIVPPAGFKAQPLYDEPVSLIDIFPTLSELCGFPVLENSDGTSLVDAMTQAHCPGRPIQSTWGENNHSIRSGKWRYTSYSDGGQELYHHGSDPHEWNNLCDDPRFADTVQQLRLAIKQR
jgi:arylsulfatase A-like enzyme